MNSEKAERKMWQVMAFTPGAIRVQPGPDGLWMAFGSAVQDFTDWHDREIFDDSTGDFRFVFGAESAQEAFDLCAKALAVDFENGP